MVEIQLLLLEHLLQNSDKERIHTILSLFMISVSINFILIYKNETFYANPLFIT